MTKTTYTFHIQIAENKRQIKNVGVYQGKKATLPLQKKKRKELQLTSHQNQWKQEENAVKSLEVLKE